MDEPSSTGRHDHDLQMDRLDALVRELRAKAAPSELDSEPAAPLASKSQKRRVVSGVARKNRFRPTRRLLVIGSASIVMLAAVAVLAKPQAEVVAPTLPSRIPTAVETMTALPALPSPGQWLTVVRELDRRRGEAFIALDKSALLSVDAAASAVLASDTSMLEALVAAHARVRKFPVQVSKVSEEFVAVGERTPRARLTVVDSMGAYDIVDAQGATLRHIAARGERTWHVELQRLGVADWRYVSVVSATSQ